MHPLEYQTKLASGRTVSLYALHIWRTYAGLMEGTPDGKYNAQLIERARRQMIPLWNERPTYVIPPDMRMVTEGGRTHERLPEMEYHLWLTSEPISGVWCGSELVVIYFGPPKHERSIGDILGPVLRDVPWDQVAGNFDY